MIPVVLGPWVYLGRAHSAADELVYDLDFDELLTLWHVEHEDYRPLLAGFERAHPNLAHITRVGLDGGARMLASPVAGVRFGDLVDLHRKQARRLPVPVAVRIALDLAAGYEALGIPTLRTGRPREACVGWDGITRVCVGPGPDPNSRSNFAPARRDAFSDFSPEAIRGRPRDMAHWSWGIGSTLFHMLTGEALEGTGSEFERLVRIAREAPPRIGDRAPELPVSLIDLVDAALQRDPDARPTLAVIGQALASLAPASPDAVADLLGNLYGDTRDHIFDTLEQLRAAPPSANDKLVVEGARFE